MRVGAFGEVMLRLTPPEYLLLEQSDSLRMAFTGTGVNLISNLSRFGLTGSLMTALPANRLGAAAEAKLKGLGIKTDWLITQHQHLGSYFAEVGYGARPTHVTYQNRTQSAFSLSATADYPLEEFVKEQDLIHICGISLSLTTATAAAALELARTAYEAGKRICFDFNFRPSLNQEPDKKRLMKQRYEAILPYCQLVFGSVRDLIELLNLAPAEAIQTAADETQLIQRFLKQYDISWFAGTRRQTALSGKTLQGYLLTQAESVTTVPQPLQILDRIGAGDAYAAGILLGFLENWPLQDTADFAAANAVLAHTLQGDVPMTTREQVQRYLQDPQQDLIR